eukprot:gene30538-39797_t
MYQDGWTPVVYSSEGLCSAYTGIKAQFLAKVQLLQAQNTNSVKRQLASMFGKAVKLVFHDAVDLDLTQPDLVGAGGRLHLSDRDAHDSADLIKSGVVSPIFTIYYSMDQAFCDKINRTDFFVLIGKLVIEKADYALHQLNT